MQGIAYYQCICNVTIRFLRVLDFAHDPLDSPPGCVWKAIMAVFFVCFAPSNAGAVSEVLDKLGRIFPKAIASIKGWLCPKPGAQRRSFPLRVGCDSV